MRIQELKCFGATAGEGNPALVIEDGPADAAARQAFARERGTTCVFLDASTEPGVACVLDYYYPHTRSPLCLHATLAAAHVLLSAENPSFPGTAGNDVPRTREPHFPSAATTLTVKTAVHGQPLVLSRDGDTCYAQLTKQTVPQPPLPDLAALLAHPGFKPVSPPQVASVGSPKLLAEVDGSATLYALHPDLPAITTWGKQAGVNGLYVYCRHPDGRFEGRNFNHLDPALEDSATGVAAGALTALLGHAIELLQGRATGRDCLLRTRIDGNAILVGGTVEPA
jgi:PhzF family phenazine biosynthesis protein